jgi:2-polyprenyl-6-methoxyphenol hydroxylase-like FAD-dependent oxidoreductase
MTTHAGKGANTAFADAFDLANLLLNRSSSTLSEYEQKMFKRGYAAVKMSLTSTQMIHATGWRGLLRDGILSVIGYTMTLINFISMPFRWYKKKRD